MIADHINRSVDVVYSGRFQGKRQTWALPTTPCALLCINTVTSLLYGERHPGGVIFTYYFMMSS